MTVDVFGAQARACAQYLAKGSRVVVDAELDWREWTTHEGQQREAVTLRARQVLFEGGRAQNGAPGNGTTQPTAAPPTTAPTTPTPAAAPAPAAAAEPASANGTPPPTTCPSDVERSMTATLTVSLVQIAVGVWVRRHDPRPIMEFATVVLITSAALNIATTFRGLIEQRAVTLVAGRLILVTGSFAIVAELESVTVGQAYETSQDGRKMPQLRLAERASDTMTLAQPRLRRRIRRVVCDLRPPAAGRDDRRWRSVSDAVSDSAGFDGRDNRAGGACRAWPPPTRGPCSPTSTRPWRDCRTTAARCSRTSRSSSGSWRGRWDPARHCRSSRSHPGWSSAWAACPGGSSRAALLLRRLR